MTESFRFRTRSGREILLVPAHAVRPLDDGANRGLERGLREDPRGRSAMMTHARDDAWSTSRDVLVVDLGVPAALGRPRWGSGAAITDWDDIPRLVDQRPIGAIARQPSKPSVHDPLAIDPRAIGPDRIDPGTIDPAQTDTWMSFVAFTVVDQHGKPLRGHARCNVDAATHASTLDATVIEHRPIPALARIELELSALHSPAPKTPA